MYVCTCRFNSGGLYIEECLICSQRLTLCGWNLSFSFNVRDTNWEAGKEDRYYHHHQQETLLTDSIQEEGSPVLLSALEDMFVDSETGRQIDTQVTPPVHSICLHSSCLTLALQISQHFVRSATDRQFHPPVRRFALCLAPLCLTLVLQISVLLPLSVLPLS